MGYVERRLARSTESTELSTTRTEARADLRQVSGFERTLRVSRSGGSGTGARVFSAT
jgi:hypothetical protein